MVGPSGRVDERADLLRATAFQKPLLVNAACIFLAPELCKVCMQPSTRRGFFLGSFAWGFAAHATSPEQALQSHTIRSKYQEGQTRIHVLLPDEVSARKRYRVLYVLSVDAGENLQFGNPLAELKRLGLQNRYDLICAYATFSQTSWYADNPLNPRIRQESYFVRDVVPFIENRYPVARDRRARLLAGFSKSGWGAFTLLLRHPDLFGKAAAWDAPLDQTDPTRWRYFAQKFGTAENFEKYRIDLLLRKRAAELRQSKRLVLMGYGLMRDLYLRTHELMTELDIPHDYVDGPLREHRWDSGWLEDAVRLLGA